MIKIAIDPGHGGYDPGAVGLNGTREKNVVLGIGLELSRLLQSEGLDVFLTRQTDNTMELVSRTALINNQRCDLAISVHCNAVANRTFDYIATFIQGKGGEAEKLANKVQPRLVAATDWPDGGVGVANLHMTRETAMPAILVECGFISNPAQEQQLGQSATQKKLARAIADGVLDYLGAEQKGETQVNWKLQIMKDAEKAGIIMPNTHAAEEKADKWFVVAVALNLLKIVKGGK